MAELGRRTKRYPSDLTDEEWARIEPLLLKPSQRGRKPAVDLREMLHAIRYMARSAGDCATFPIKARCTTGKERRIKRWENEAVIDAMQRRLDRQPDAMRLRRQTAEHPFGTLKAWMGAAHFLTRGMKRVSTEMSLQVLAYNMKRLIAIKGIGPLMKAIPVT